MNTTALLSQLRSRQIRVWAEGDRLRCSAAPGALTAELRERLRNEKAEILEFLSMASALHQQGPAMVPLQAKGINTPIFAVPGHNGDVFCYRALAHHLGGDQPLFGLQPPGLDGSSAPLNRTHALAAYFAAQILACSRDGPCIIAGFCAGGTIAFELAQQLLKAGREVRFLALFGSPYPAFFRLSAQFMEALSRRTRSLEKRIRVMRALRMGEQLRYVRAVLAQRQARRAEDDHPAEEDPALLRRHQVEQATIAAVRIYKPEHFPGRLCLFLPDPKSVVFDDLTHKWCLHSAASHTFHGPEGSTSDTMLKEPHAAAFAQLLRDAQSLYT